MRMLLLRTAIVVISLPGLVGALSATETIRAPYQTPADELIAIAQAHETTEDLVILLQERTITLDDQGRATRSTRMIYQVRTEAGAEGWDAVSVHWSPWYQERPELDARVIGPGGEEHRLDPSTIAESPARETTSKIYSDSKVLRAPLPAIRPGTIVEETTVTRETRAFFDAGVISTQLMAHYYPVLRSTLTVDAPEGAAIHWTAHLIELEPVTERSDGRVRMTWTTTNTEPLEDRETNLPAEMSGIPLVAIATGQSWQQVAAAYHEIVQAGLRSGELSIPLPPRADDPVETVRRTVSTLHDHIRYTGLEFGENSIVPRNLAEVQTKQYGDCKDKATLLIRMLAEQGIEARVALLRTGSGMDVFDSLPGLGLFDHAIVWIPSLELFVDATADMTRVGSLPSSVQGRKALIADPSTTSLVEIPAQSSHQNQQIESRVVTLSPYGRGRVVETIRGTGQIEESFRHSVRDATPEDLEEMYGDYAQSAYLDDEIDAVHVVGASEVDDELAITLEMDGAGRAVTDMQEAVVAIMISDLFDRLPYTLFTEDEDDDEKRKNDFVFSPPHQVEWNYEIEPPVGFSVLRLPESTEIRMGEAVYAQAFEERDGKVYAKLSFDSGPRRISSATYQEMKSALTKRLEEPALLLRWENDAQAHLVRGEVREAIEELERLRETDPEDALIHMRLALAYLQAGLGEDARSEIDRAIAMDPDQSILHSQKAYILQHDLFGRHMAPGWDRNAAIEAFARAWELDPEDEDIAFNAAVLHEFDDRGVRYAPDADLPGAVAWYRKVEDTLFETPGFDMNLPLALLYDRKYDELEVMLDERPAISTRDVYRAVLAMVDGGPERSRAAANLISNRSARAESMISAGQILIRLRKYPEAAAVYREAAPLSENAAQLTELADMLSRIDIDDDGETGLDDPAAPVRRLMRLMFDLEREPRELTACFSRAIGAQMTEEDYEEADRMINALRRQLDDESTPLHFIADLSNAMLQYGVEGNDEDGYRVFLQGMAGMSGGEDAIFYVVREGDGYVIVGTSDDLPTTAWEVLARLDRGDRKGAAALLDLIREDVPEVSRKDALETSIFAKIWQLGAEPDEPRMRLASAVLLAHGEDRLPGEGLEILESLSGEVLAAHEPWSSMALATAYAATNDFVAMREITARLIEQHPESDTAANYHLGALTGSGDWAGLEGFARSRLDRNRDDRVGLRALARAKIEAGDDEAAMELYGRLVTTGRPAPSDFNDAAWFSILGSPNLDTAIQWAQSAAKMAENVPAVSASILNTLAAVYAEAGRPIEAKMTIWKSMDDASLAEPRHSDWYVLGRIAEYYGLEDAAARSYRKVLEQSEFDTPGRGSVETLARQRLAQLAN